MKVTSITFIDTANLPVREPRNTETAKIVKGILENLAKAPAGKSLVMSLSEEPAKYERYQLQKRLQDAGAHVTVGTAQRTEKDGNKEVVRHFFTIRKLTDAEWKEWQKD